MVWSTIIYNVKNELAKTFNTSFNFFIQIYLTVEQKKKFMFISHGSDFLKSLCNVSL